MSSWGIIANFGRDYIGCTASQDRQSNTQSKRRGDPRQHAGKEGNGGRPLAKCVDVACTDRDPCSILEEENQLIKTPTKAPRCHALAGATSPQIIGSPTSGITRVSEYGISRLSATSVTGSTSPTNINWIMISWHHRSTSSVTAACFTRGPVSLV